MAGETELMSRLDRWRDAVAASGHPDAASLAAAEEALARELSTLRAAGLGADESFLVALTRVSAVHPATREFARSYADGLLTAPLAGAGAPPAERRAGAGAAAAGAAGAERPAASELWVMLGCAAGAALAIKIPALFGYRLSGDGEDVYVLNLSIFVLPFLVAYFAWRRPVPRRCLLAIAAAFVAAAVFANVYPFAAGGSTLMLTALHLPVVLWLMAGVASAGGDWRADAERMDYTRFTGEWFVTFVLIGLGGGVLIALTVGVFGSIGLDAGPVVEDWIAPCGAMAAVVVAAWLVETGRTSAIAPMLARVFTPLFAVMLVALLAGVLWTRDFMDVGREVLILFDLLLVVVLALLLYAFSARDPRLAPGLFDRIQLVLVSCALVVDLFALAGIAVRLGQFGVSANKTAALGLNLILLVNLGRSAYLQAGFVRSRRDFAQVERWQMRYLPVYLAWAAVVVVAFPPLFGFA